MPLMSYESVRAAFEQYAAKTEGGPIRAVRNGCAEPKDLRLAVGGVTARAPTSKRLRRAERSATSGGRQRDYRRWPGRGRT